MNTRACSIMNAGDGVVMKIERNLYLIAVIAIVAAVTWFIFGNVISSDRSGYLNEGDMKTEDENQIANDPCWFVKGSENVSKEEFKKYWDREQYGYPEGITLKESVRIFNEEENCFPYTATLLPLTEEEVIAAIISGPDYGNEGDLWLAQKGDLFKVVSQKIMPKGSLFDSNGSVRLPDSPLGKAVGKGRRIYLFLGLDKNPRQSNKLGPEQTFLIRKTFFSVDKSDEK